MPLKYVTCPETAHLELLDLDHHPLGTLVNSCSRFLPGCELECTRSCAMLLDRRLRARGESLASSLASSLTSSPASLSIGDETRHDLDLETVFAQQRSGSGSGSRSGADLEAPAVHEDR